METLQKVSNLLHSPLLPLSPRHFPLRPLLPSPFPSYFLSSPRHFPLTSSFPSPFPLTLSPPLAISPLLPLLSSPFLPYFVFSPRIFPSYFLSSPRHFLLPLLPRFPVLATTFINLPPPPPPLHHYSHLPPLSLSPCFPLGPPHLPHPQFPSPCPISATQSDVILAQLKCYTQTSLLYNFRKLRLCLFFKFNKKHVNEKDVFHSILKLPGGDFQIYSVSLL